MKDFRKTSCITFIVLGSVVLGLGVYFGWWKLSELTSIILTVLVGGISASFIFLFKDSNRSAQSKVVSSNTSPKSAFGFMRLKNKHQIDEEPVFEAEILNKKLAYVRGKDSVSFRSRFRGNLADGYLVNKVSAQIPDSVHDVSAYLFHPKTPHIEPSRRYVVLYHMETVDLWKEIVGTKVIGKLNGNVDTDWLSSDWNIPDNVRLGNYVLQMSVINNEYTESKKVIEDTFEVIDSDSSACDEWKTDYRKHSLEIGKTISDTWLNARRLATCEYKNGRLELNPALEPAGENVGLAREHLVNGYPESWKLYEKAKAESSDICNKILEITNSFEENVSNVVDSKNQEYNLQRKSIGYSAKKCDDLHYYIDRHIFQAIFEEIQDQLDGKPRRAIMERQLIVYNLDGIKCPAYSLLWRAFGLGSGTHYEMSQLETKVENIINDPNIISLIERYNEQINNLWKSQLKKSYHAAIDGIWTDILDNGEMLLAAGSCKNIKECKPRPPGC